MTSGASRTVQPELLVKAVEYHPVRRIQQLVASIEQPIDNLSPIVCSVTPEQRDAVEVMMRSSRPSAKRNASASASVAHTRAARSIIRSHLIQMRSSSADNQRLIQTSDRRRLWQRSRAGSSQWLGSSSPTSRTVRTKPR
jgi:hypothetical protein